MAQFDERSERSHDVPSHTPASGPAPAEHPEVDNGKVEAAIARIREAVAEKREPSRADLELAQHALGNARVSEMLHGEHLAAAPGLAAQGEYKLVVYARHRFANGPLDTGHAFIGLEGPGLDHTYGFHPATAGQIMALMPGGVAGQVRVDKDQIGHGVRMLEVPVSKQQWEAAQRVALSLKSSPPRYDFYGYNCVGFVQTVAAAAGVHVPVGHFAGIADPETTADYIDKHSGEKPAAGGGAAGGAGGAW